MSMHENIFINYNKIDINNISYAKPMHFYDSNISRTMGIYYRKQNSKRKQKIIIRTPKMVVPFGIKEFDNKTFSLALSFRSLTHIYNEEEIKSFYKFVEAIDKVNESTVMDNKKKLKLPKKIKYRKSLQKLSEDFPHHINVNLPRDESTGFLFTIYDENKQKSNIDIIKKQSIISLVLELTDLKFNDKFFRANWTVMQIRKFHPYSPLQSFFMKECYLLDSDEDEKPLTKTVRSPVAVISEPDNVCVQPYIRPPKIEEESVKQVIFTPPTLQQLLSMKGSLRKTETVEKKLISGKVIDDDSSIPVPPPIPSQTCAKKKSKKSRRDK